jgi:hypothetical protein
MCVVSHPDKTRGGGARTWSLSHEITNSTAKIIIPKANKEDNETLLVNLDFIGTPKFK